MREGFKKGFIQYTTLFTWRRVGILLAAIVLIAAILFGGLIWQAKAYQDKVAPGVQIGNIAVGGLTREELKNFLNSMNDKLQSSGLRFTFTADGAQKEFSIQPVIVTEDNAIEWIYIDVEKEVERVMNYGRQGGVVIRALAFEQARFSRPVLRLENIFIDKAKLTAEIKERLSEYQTEPLNASVKLLSLSPLRYEITPASTGTIYLQSEAINKLRSAWSELAVSDIEIDQREVKPNILESDVGGIIARLPVVFDSGSITLTYTDRESKKEFEWTVDSQRIVQWLNVQKIGNNSLGFGLEKDKVLDYFETYIAPKINIDSRDAKFRVDESGRVVEFQGSRSGIKLDLTATYGVLNQAMLDRTSHNEGLTKTIALTVKKIEPNVTTGEVNDLGISELLGTGISDFKGSPLNRIKNIKNGAKKLNGVLIKPDGEFSAIKYTEPYTEDGGYLPELVIKGSEIKPEIGGGLCQIGTTLFRMAMNSAMPITARRNHSLVVNYYNDLVNGLPGTDATFYDPAPDFKFKNDTGNYLLIQTEVDEKEQRLYFSLWGTSDGRKGRYDAPEVTKWIEYGPTQYIETTTLPPGQKKCQHAFRGAEANFKYIRDLADGAVEERVFESYYRPLPEICLVGVEEKSVENCFTVDGQIKESCDEINPENDDQTPLIVE